MYDPSKWWNPENYPLLEDRTGKSIIDACHAAAEKQVDGWLENVRANIPALPRMRPVSELHDTEQAKPVLIVGAGPSAQQFDTIRHLKSEGCLIIAVDRIYAALKANGISPDYTISADGQDCVIDFFSTIDRADRFVMCVKQSPSVVGHVLNSGAAVFAYATINPFTKCAVAIRDSIPWEFQGLVEGPTVGCVALSLALAMGCETIFAIGCECGWLHTEDIEKMYMEQKMFMVNASHVIVWSTPIFLIAARYFEWFAEQHPDRQFYNLSGGLVGKPWFHVGARA